MRLAETQEPHSAASTFQQLANTRMDFVRAGRLDKAVQRYRSAHGNLPGLPVVRLALLGSSTLGHLHAGVRVGALRHGVLVDVYENAFGMYRQEAADVSSGLHAFRPDVVCLALDAHHVAASGGEGRAEQVLADLRELWRAVKEMLGCVVVQQTVLPVHWPVMGNQESRLPQSPASVVESVNRLLRSEAEAQGVYLLTVDTWAAIDGLSRWFEPALWNRSKQEVHPRVSDLYGEQVGRILAALRGKSSKCLVLDLDNTLWGGVIGDDGMEGIVLGQGSAVGEAHVALQRYALQLSERGIILAVCSKNDEANALAPFADHLEMVLRRKHIACFVANWQDKATNLRYIAETLNIGLDSLVFVDDNPAERALVRRELPMVAVPELPEDPSGYVGTLAAAGYFEALEVTAEDRARAELYRSNAERENLRRSTTDMGGFLQALQMELTWSPFDSIGLKRIVQLMNKTNQFNLTTRRYTEAEVAAMLDDPSVLTLQLRLSDVYGDNGVIALLVGRLADSATLDMETWLMSCRVLGRNVEEATLNVLVEQARAMGCTRIVGTYRPTAKNGMVRDHYQRLGFAALGQQEDATRWELWLDSYASRDVPMTIKGGKTWTTHTCTAS
ncbi:HAD-IIIC family phosphatase [Terriglobus aquaticus]|uniref:HAD-IIIC family phosphatase n=1 Tax=Terriglobus aquaticus TaxID=940139 RepID=UPI0021DFD107|nr:HAD-IIIC family phosphatase [Terriglobus aquaticus]